MVATHGDVKTEVNRGINCVKGYFLSKIMYGADRLTTPLLRMKNGKYDKNGEFDAGVVGPRVRRDGRAVEARAQGEGPDRCRHVRFRPMDGLGRLRGARSSCKAGFRTNNLDPNARHCMASAVAGFMRTFGIDEPMGCYDDIEDADAFVLWGSNMAEMHPVLWTRVTDRRLSAPATQGRRAVGVRAPLLRARRPADHLHAADRPGDPQLHRDHIIRTNRVNRDVRRQAHGVQARQRRHRLRAAPRAPAAEGGEERRRCERLQAHRRSTNTRNSSRPTTLDTTAKLTGVPKSQLDALAELYADPKIKVMSFWTMGFNQHTRGVWANKLCLQPAPAHRQDRDARQQPVLADGPAVGLRHGARGRHVLPSPAGGHGGDQSRAPREDRGRSGIPRRDDPGQARLSRRAAEPDAQGREAQRVLGAGQQQHAGRGEHDARRAIPGYRNPANFIVVSEAYPTVTALAADLVLPDGDVGREGRRLRQRRAAHAVLAPAGRCAGRSALRSVAARRVLQALQDRGGLAGGADRETARGTRQDALRRAVPQRQGRQVSLERDRGRLRERRSARPSASTCRKACSRSTPSSAAAMATTWRRSTRITRRAACAGRS